MRILSFIIWALLLSPLAPAATTALSIADKLDALKIERTNLAKKIEDYQNEMNEKKEAVTKLEQELDARGGFFGTLTSSQRQQLSSNLKEARKQHNLAKNEIELRLNRTALEHIDAEIDSTYAQYSKAEKNQREATIALQQKVEAQGLKIHFMDLNAKLGSADAALDYIERVYDKSLVGAYFQDKIGQLLNSQVICAARKRCLETGAQKIDSKEIRKELFPLTEAVRTDYYEKVNGPGSSK